MPLIDIGPALDTLSGAITRTLNQADQHVLVETTHEAIQDFGWGVIMPMASQKYDDGELEAETPAKVRVTTADCQRWIDANA